MNQRIDSLSHVDIYKSLIREKMPKILNILLIDRTTSTPSRTKNIIWETNHYKNTGLKCILLLRKYFQN